MQSIWLALRALVTNTPSTLNALDFNEISMCCFSTILFGTIILIAFTLLDWITELSFSMLPTEGRKSPRWNSTKGSWRIKVCTLLGLFHGQQRSNMRNWNSEISNQGRTQGGGGREESIKGSRYIWCYSKDLPTNNVRAVAMYTGITKTAICLRLAVRMMVTFRTYTPKAIDFIYTCSTIITGAGCTFVNIHVTTWA